MANDEREKSESEKRHERLEDMLNRLKGTESQLRNAGWNISSAISSAADGIPGKKSLDRLNILKRRLETLTAHIDKVRLAEDQFLADAKFAIQNADAFLAGVERDEESMAADR